MLLLVLVLEVVPQRPLGAQLGQHVARGDEVVVCARGDGEDGVFEARRRAAHAEDVFLPDVGRGHRVQRQQHRALCRPRLACDVPRGASWLRLGERDEGHAAQDGGDAGGLADVRGDVVGGDARLRQAAQRQVQQRRVGVLGVALQRLQRRVRGVPQVLLAGVDDAVEPVPAQPGFPPRAGVQVLGGVGEQDGDGLFRRRAREGFGDGVAPELHAHHAHGGGAGGVRDAGDVDVEGADGEVGIARGVGYEGLEDVRGRVVGADEVGAVGSCALHLSLGGARGVGEALRCSCLDAPALGGGDCVYAYAPDGSCAELCSLH